MRGAGSTMECSLAKRSAAISIAIAPTAPRGYVVPGRSARKGGADRTRVATCLPFKLAAEAAGTRSYWLAQAPTLVAIKRSDASFIEDTIPPSARQDADQPAVR